MSNVQISRSRGGSVVWKTITTNSREEKINSRKSKHLWKWNPNPLIRFNTSNRYQIQCPSIQSQGNNFDAAQGSAVKISKPLWPQYRRQHHLPPSRSTPPPPAIQSRYSLRPAYPSTASRVCSRRKTTASKLPRSDRRYTIWYTQCILTIEKGNDRP